MWKAGRLLAFGSVVMAWVALAPVDVLAQKKKKNNNATQYPVATEADYAALQKNSVKVLTGSIISFDDKSITLRNSYQTIQPNPNYKTPVLNKGTKGYNPQSAQMYQLSRRFSDLQRQMAKAATARTPAQAMQAQMRMQQDMMAIQMQYMQLQAQLGAALNNPNNQPFQQVTNTKDYTLDLQDKVVYRKTFLPMEYDDQGNPKKYTAEEKRALLAEDKKNYKATAADLQVGQEATCYLTLPKKKSKSEEDDTPPEHATINKVVLTKDAPASSSSSATPAPKKKKN